MKVTFELQGNTIEYNNDGVTDESEMAIAFSDGEEGHEYCYARHWQNCIGVAFHLIQQTGGNLTLNGKQICAASFSDTNGRSVNQGTLVILADGLIVSLSEVLKQH